MPETLIRQLPAIYQDSQRNWFLHLVLGAIEDLFLGQGSQTQASPEGLAAKIAKLPSLFNPRLAPPEFLEWLSGWVALSVRAELSEAKRRDIISGIVPLYEVRGTPEGVRKTIKLFTDCESIVEELPDIPLQIQVHSSIGSDMYLNGPPPFTFHVALLPPPLDAEQNREQARQVDLLTSVARGAIDLMKPAHTRYTLSMQNRSKQENAA